MNESEKLSSELHDIKQMMERSSRFISLSGLSGVAAGICGLIGASVAKDYIDDNNLSAYNLKHSIDAATSIWNSDIFYNRLFQIAIITFIAAFVLAFIFTYRRSKKTGVPIWGNMAKRLMINVSVPIITGGIFLFALLQSGIYAFVSPGCLIFYGLGMLNASKYTLYETRYLGYGEIILGIINLFFVGDGLYFWAAGFGLLHIIYGILMWMKYERN